VGAVPIGVKIEQSGFKTLTSQNLELGAAQTVRQTFILEVGQVSENVTMAETSPLVETASSEQEESLGSQQVTELPLARRSLVNVVILDPGTYAASIGIAGGGNIFLNGVAEGGNAVTVDGTDAIANPETRGMGQYGGQSQLSPVWRSPRRNVPRSSRLNFLFSSNPQRSRPQRVTPR
jgi:hypothetical protein